MKKENWGGTRQGAGRKPVPVVDKAKPRSIMATDHEWEMVKRMAKDNGLSISQFILSKLEVQK